MIFLTSIVKNSPFVNVNEIEVDILMVDQHLQHLHFLQWFRSTLIFHITETIKNGRSVVFIKSIDFTTIIYQ